MRPHRKRPARRKVAKKVPAAPARPSRVPPRAKRPSSQPQYSDGGGGSFVTVLMAILALALAVFVAMIVLPADLEGKIDGYGGGVPVGEEPKNLLPEMQEVIIDASKTAEFTEADLNRYLAQRVKGEQKGTFGGFVKYTGTYVDVRPGVAEFYIEREMFGMPMTMSCEVKRTGVTESQETWEIGGGSLGKLRMSELSFAPVIRPFIRMSQSVVDDMDVFKKVSRIEFQEGKVVLGKQS